jgi:hypothetical protein
MKVERLRRKESRYNINCAIINGELEKFHGSPAWKEAHAFIERSYTLVADGSCIKNSELEEDAQSCDFSEALARMQLDQDQDQAGD